MVVLCSRGEDGVSANQFYKSQLLSNFSSFYYPINLSESGPSQ